jgi:hypothetical protein
LRLDENRRQNERYEGHRRCVLLHVPIVAYKLLETAHDQHG